MSIDELIIAQLFIGKAYREYEIGGNFQQLLLLNRQLSSQYKNFPLI